MALASDVDAPGNDDFTAHTRTYRTFVRYTVIFVAHVLLILALMAYFLT
jgi:hypothetical protein